MKESFQSKEPFHLGFIKSDIKHLGGREFNEITTEDGARKVVRQETFNDIKERYDGKVDPTIVVDLAKKLFREIELDYGICAPVEFAIDKNIKGKDVVYCVTDKIEGVDLNKVENTPEFIKELETLYVSISSYYLNKLNNKEAYLADINNMSQYVYGKKKGDEKSKIYLVDTDLYLNKGDASILHNVKWLIRHMPIKFDKALENIHKIIETPLNLELSNEDRILSEKEIKESLSLLNGTFKRGNEKDEIGFIPTSL